MALEEDERGLGDFSLEMEDFEYAQVKKFDRIFNVGEGGSFMQRPLVLEGKVYVGSLDRNVYCVDARTGGLVWKYRTEAGIGPASAVTWDGKVFIGSRDHFMYALDAKTGKLAWRFRTEDKITGCAAEASGRLYFGSNDHSVYCLDAGTGRLVWKFRTQGEVASTPTFHEGRLYVGSYDHFLYCLDADNGRLFWKFETQGDVFCQPDLLVHEGRVYFPSFDNYLRVVDVRTGRLVWKFLTGRYGGMGTGPVMNKGVLYQVNREGVIYALTMDGRELWNFRINHAMANPIIHEDRIYFGTEEQNLYCLSLEGKVLWKFPTQGIMWWKPAFWNRNVYFTSSDCFLYCVDIDTHGLVWKFRAQGAPSYVPPPFDSFELVVKKHVDESDAEEREGVKRYDVAAEEREGGGFYKSRVTYQTSTRYREKGKYQSGDGDEF